LALSQLLTLYTTPIVFVGLEALRAKVMGPRQTPSVQLPFMVGQSA
jgi:energy-converting hydrogenase Eha subunit A